MFQMFYWYIRPFFSDIWYQNRRYRHYDKLICSNRLSVLYFNTGAPPFNAYVIRINLVVLEYKVCIHPFMLIFDILSGRLLYLLRHLMVRLNVIISSSYIHVRFEVHRAGYLHIYNKLLNNNKR